MTQHPTVSPPPPRPSRKSPQASNLTLRKNKTDRNVNCERYDSTSLHPALPRSEPSRAEPGQAQAGSNLLYLITALYGHPEEPGSTPSSLAFDLLPSTVTTQKQK